MGYPRPEPEELQTLQNEGMACTQDHVFLTSLSDAYRVHHCRYVFIHCPVRCTTDQLVLSA